MAAGAAEREKVMNQYEAKQEARRQRLEAAAARAEAKANAAFRRGDLREEVSGIPMGQPILVGHHSERRHRNAIKRAQRAMRAGIEASERAKQLSQRAAAVGSGGISADDPDAPAKLRDKLAALEKSQANMKLANATIRKHAKSGLAAQVAALVELGYSERHATALVEPDVLGRVGFPDYALTNNNANIRRVMQRLAEVERQAQRIEAVGDAEPTDEKHGDITLRRNLQENRLQLIFPGKPSAAARETLKRHGFRWAPSAGAWQRQLTGSAEFSAAQVLKALAQQVAA